MPIIADIQQVPYVERFSIQKMENPLLLGSEFDTSRVELPELQVGSIKYPLRGKLSGRYIRALGELFVDGVSPVFVGKGSSEQEAIDDFSLRVHADFQDLLYKRPFEMDTDELSKWQKINEIIDVTVYRNITPVVVRQFGVVQFGSLPYPSQIRWDNDHVESVHPAQVDSPDFITFKPGQPIEAFVVRNSLTRELIRISNITRTRSLRTSGEIKKSGLAERIGTSADLPDANWD